MSDSDWFAQRLGVTAPRPAATRPEAPSALPPHLAPYAQPLAARAPGTPAAPAPPSSTVEYDASGRLVDVAAAALTPDAVARGNSKAVQDGSGTCPNCGGGNYFRVDGAGVMSLSGGGRVSPMICADCGYPTIQAGSQGGALQAAGSLRGSSSVPVAGKARQLPSNHRVVVLDGSSQATFEPFGAR